MGRPLSPSQIPQKNISTLSKLHKTTSVGWKRTSGNQKSRPLSSKTVLLFFKKKDFFFFFKANTIYTLWMVVSVLFCFVFLFVCFLIILFFSFFLFPSAFL